MGVMQPSIALQGVLSCLRINQVLSTGICLCCLPETGTPTLANAELHTLNKQIPKSNKTYDQNPTPVIPHHAPNIISYKSYTVLPKP